MSTRRDFLAVSSLFALAPEIAGAAPPSRPHAKEPSFHFDQSRFADILAKPAKHKQCFGATEIAGGGVLFGMNNSMSAYEDYLNEGPGSMQTVAVLYHGPAIALAMSDSVWNDLLTPLLRNRTFLKNASIEEHVDYAQLTLGKGNPFLRSSSSDPDDVSVERLVSKGSSFFVCHNAIAGFSGILAGVLKQPRQKVHAAIMSGIVPGALAVPAGVMAINACQEAKFTYIQSSL